MRPLVGTWRIQTDIAPGNPGPNRNAPSRGRQGTMQLTAGVSSAPDGFAAIATQYVASANLPGYAVPAATGRGRGRRTPSSPVTPTTWWPAHGDSVIVHIVGARGNRIQLRGRLSGGGTIRGEVWLMSLETGNAFQLGNFTATKTSSRQAR